MSALIVYDFAIVVLVPLNRTPFYLAWPYEATLFNQSARFGRHCCCPGWGPALDPALPPLAGAPSPPPRSPPPAAINGPALSARIAPTVVQNMARSMVCLPEWFAQLFLYGLKLELIHARNSHECGPINLNLANMEQDTYRILLAVGRRQRHGLRKCQESPRLGNSDLPGISFSSSKRGANCCRESDCETPDLTEYRVIARCG